MSDLNIDLSKIKEARAASKKALENLQTLADVDNSAPTQDLINRALQYMQSFDGRIGYLEDTVQNHMKGHLPALKSREHMDRAIKKLGLDQEYEAAPKKIVYANSKHGPIVTIGADVEIPSFGK